MNDNYKTEKAWNEWDINNVLQRNLGWKPLFMTPFTDSLTKKQQEQNLAPNTQFMIMFEKEDSK